MANQIYIPHLNPPQFVEINPTILPQYGSKHMDDFLHYQQIREWQERPVYKQKWQTSDAVWMQFTSDFAPIILKLIDCENNVVLTQTATQRLVNRNFPTFYVYEAAIALNEIPEGTYWITKTYGGNVNPQMISEPLDVKVYHPETLYIEYFNTKYHGEVLFETKIVFSLRIEGIIEDFDPSALKTVYNDQHYDPTLLKATPFRAWTLFLGKDYGIPNWLIDKMNWVFSCNNIYLDGKLYGSLGDSKFEAIELHREYPLRAWSLKIQEGINRSSKMVFADVNTNKKMTMSLVTDSTLFGGLSGGTGSNLITIQATD